LVLQWWDDNRHNPRRLDLVDLIHKVRFLGN
jgi:hypothetical protein